VIAVRRGAKAGAVDQCGRIGLMSPGGEVVRVAWRVGRRLCPVLALITAACASFQDSAPTINTWATASLRQEANPPSRSDPVAGAALNAERRAGRATYIEGTGRFVGPQPERSAPDSNDSGDGITLNLVNVPIAQASKTVLGDIMAAHYTVDPGIEGKITIQTPKPVPKPVVLDLFQTALRANNVAITDGGGGIYKIVPADQAANGARIAIGNNPPSPETLGAGLQVVQLQYVSASEMKRILEPISPHGGVVRADPARNTLTLSGTRQDLAGMAEAISVFDVDVMKGMSFAMIPVKTSLPSVIAGELQKVFSTAEEGPMAGMVRFLPNKRLGAVLVISPQPRYLPRAESWIRRLDAQASGKEKQFYTYKVQNRRAQEMVDVLKSIFGSEGSSSRGGRNVTPRSEETTLASSTSSPFSSQGGDSRSTRLASSGGSAYFGAGQNGGMNGPEHESASQSAAPGADAGAQLVMGEAENTEAPPIKVAADGAKNAILVLGVVSRSRDPIRQPPDCRPSKQIKL
jgi:general secretion pathway protein D